MSRALRPTPPTDTPTLVRLAEATGVFKPLEIVALGEVFDDFHAQRSGPGHQCVSLLVDDQLVGFCYFAPAAMTEGTWYLYWIAVDPARQGQGLGSVLLRHAEEQIAQQAGRHLLIETSSLPHYQPTRQFYLRHRYQQVAQLPDFYAEGDDMVVFRKVLLGNPPEGGAR